MLKPDTLRRKLVAEVTHMLTDAGYKIEFFALQTVSSEKMFRHYGKLVSDLGEPFKLKVTAAFDGKQVIPMILSSQKPEIIENTRRLLGATDPSKADKNTIRGKHGIDSLEKASEEMRFCENLVHASDSVASFDAEIKIWFPKSILKFLSK